MFLSQYSKFDRTARDFNDRAFVAFPDVTTAYIPRATIAEDTTVSILNAESVTTRITTAAPRALTSTDRPSRNKARERGGEGTRTKKKEDFFNHGLGFRGRRISTEATSTTNVADLTATTTPRSETQLRGNPGWTLRRRPGHTGQDVTSTTPTLLSRDQTNEIISSNDSPRNTEAGSRRGGKRPKVKDEGNVAPTGSTKSVTRGNKTFNKVTEGFGLPRKMEEESDNYPPAFRARLSQLVSSHFLFACYVCYFDRHFMRYLFYFIAFK